MFDVDNDKPPPLPTLSVFCYSLQVSPRDAPSLYIMEGEVMTRCSADHHPAKAKPLLMALKPTDGDGRSQRGQLERASWTQVRDIDNVSVVGHPKFFQKN